MTIKEALKAKSENLSVSDGKLDLVLFEASLDGNKDYDPKTDNRSLDMVYITLLLESISITEVREDDVSIKYTSNLKDIVSALSRKWGLKDPFAVSGPKLKTISHPWS